MDVQKRGFVVCESLIDPESGSFRLIVKGIVEKYLAPAYPRLQTPGSGWLG